MDIKDLDIGDIEDKFSMARYELSLIVKKLDGVSDIDNSLSEMREVIAHIENVEDTVINTLKRNK